MINLIQDETNISVPNNADVKNFLIGISILIKYDSNLYFDPEFFYPSLGLYAKVLSEDLTPEEREIMINKDWVQFLDKGEIYWQYDFVRKYYD